MMFVACVIVLVAACAGDPAREGVPAEVSVGTVEELKKALQQVLDSVVTKHGGNAALQLGWKSASAEFALAAGVVPQPGVPSSVPRPTTVNDTFLFGSGTKPYTASGVMALRDQGLLSLDDALEVHVDPVLAKLKPGTTLRGLFGEAAAHITVGHTVRMQSGVQDFDVPTFDNLLLRANETYRVHSPVEFVEYASTQKPSLICAPGTCVSYSSNNFVLAGFVLLAHANVTDWWDLDLPSLFPAQGQLFFSGSHFFQRENLQNLLTVPGHTGGGWAKTPPVLIWNQSSTILGWTCGNMVTTALDVAKFMWGLLGPHSDVLPASTVEEMKHFVPLNKGWAAGSIQYGTGLMIESMAYTPGRPPTLPDWGTYIGHGGDTYGFLSEQGIVSGLNASLSIVANQDTDGGIVQQEAFCQSIVVAAKVLLGKTLSFPCRSRRREGPPTRSPATAEQVWIV